MSLCEHCGHVESQCQCGKMSKDGREIKGLRVIGYQNAERFLKTLSLATAP